MTACRRVLRRFGDRLGGGLRVGAVLVVAACSGPVPAPPGTPWAPGEPPAPPSVAPAPTVEALPTECASSAECRLAMVGRCRNELAAVPVGTVIEPLPYLPAHSCRRLEPHPAVAPDCIAGRCVATPLVAPELRTCVEHDDCILMPAGCHTTPIRADAREEFTARFPDGAPCARAVHEEEGVCSLGTCSDPAWMLVPVP